MIGLMFLGAAVLWLVVVYQITLWLPKWLNLKKHAWTAQALVALVLLVGPFVDHIVGMRQFEKLCAEDGRLEISPAAASTKRAKELSGQFETLQGYAIPIDRQVRRIIDLDSGEQIAQYKYFSTPGGVVGKLPQLGGLFTCSARWRKHKDSEKYDELAAQTKLTF